LTSIDVETNNEKFCSIDGVLFNKNKMELIKYPAAKSENTYMIPNSVISIDYDAFDGCSKLTSIDVETNNSKFYSIDGVLFMTLYSQGALVIYPAGKTDTTFAIPNVPRVFSFAFNGCKNLKQIICHSAKPPEVSSSFDGKITEQALKAPVANIKLYVPAGSVDAYRTHIAWGRFSSISSIEGTPIYDRNNKKNDNKHGILIEKNPVTADFAEIRVVVTENEKLAEMKLAIYDNVGNVLFEKTEVRKDIILWNLTNTAGRRVANGSYLAVVEATTVNKKVYRYSAKIGVKK